MKYFFFLIFTFSFLLLAAQHDPIKTEDKFRRALQYMRLNYVDSIDEVKLTEIAIKKMLEELDPHSVYMSADEIKQANEQLQGNFDGIGVQFQIIRDTINVVDVISGGPSETVGIRAGDKIINIDKKNATGKSINNAFVMKNLRGVKGSVVNVDIKRPNEKELLEFSITRDKIPIYSLDAAYMLTPKIGYIKLNKFGETTMREFNDAIRELEESKFESLILDLRNNGGGYLKTAVELADQFIPKNKVIVYTEGRNERRYDYNATSKGCFEKGNLVVLINEGSASASEIVSGAIQDYDRGLIMGRRSFGKGLVQRPFNFIDGSAMRLTVSRYYTPSGRCIQRPYGDGNEDYSKELEKRLAHGELSNKDSIKFPDSLKYKTEAGRVVYGGGGIMPDVFIPMDTAEYSEYYKKLFRKNVYSIFIADYVIKNRERLLAEYKNIAEFKAKFKIKDDFRQLFFDEAEKNGVPFDKEGFEQSARIIETIIRASLARSLYGNESYYQIISEIDNEILIAVEYLEKPKNFKKYLDKN